MVQILSVYGTSTSCRFYQLFFLFRMIIVIYHLFLDILNGLSKTFLLVVATVIFQSCFSNVFKNFKIEVNIKTINAIWVFGLNMWDLTFSKLYIYHILFDKIKNINESYCLGCPVWGSRTDLFVFERQQDRLSSGDVLRKVEWILRRDWQLSTRRSCLEIGTWTKGRAARRDAEKIQVRNTNKNV